MGEELAAAVRRSRVLLLDVEGTTTSIAFVKEQLFPYAEANVQGYLESAWETAEVRAAVAALRRLALEDSASAREGVVAIPAEDATKEDQIEGLVGNVKWQMSSDRKAGPLKLLQGLVWKQGYDKGELRGHVFDDVSAALEQWVSEDKHEIYIYSSGSVDAQKLLFGFSSAGDLLPHVAGHFDTAVGAKQEAGSYTNIADKIGCKPDEILFLTDILTEATAAREAGLNVALVSRAGNAPLPAEVPFPVLHSLSELAASNKRKIDTQEEQPACKIAKTSPEEPVKTLSVESAVCEEPAGMDVDSETVSKPVEPTGNQNGEEKTEQTAEEAKSEVIKENIVIEEVMEYEKIDPTADVDIEPVAIEEPTQAVDTMKMSVDEPSKCTEPKEVIPKEQVKCDDKVTKDSPHPQKLEKIVDKIDPEESDSGIITEIEEITDKKDDEIDANIDIDPIIEEPLDSAVLEDVDEALSVLQSVGDDLNKECDDIMSKVNEVTNLTGITVKPLVTGITVKPLVAPVGEESSEQTHSDPKVAEELSTADTTVAEKSSPVESTGTEAAVAESKNTEEKAVVIPTEKVIKKSESTSAAAEIAPPKPDTTSTAEEKTSKEPETTSSAEEIAPKESESSTPEGIATNGAEEKHLNGTNEAKDANDKVNGDATNGEERLSAENGSEERTNGSNGKAAEEGSKEEAADVPEIKVKSVPAAETHTEPVAQATDA